MDVVICLAIFAIALLVRGAYLYESSANPAFYSLTLDSRDYYLRAETLATKGILDSGFFWQPVFYPFSLAALFLITGPSILWAKLCQIVLGAVTCVLTYRLGCRVFDRRTGLLAGLIVACYGPLVFYECEIDTAGWAVFWSAAFLLLLLHARAKGSPILYFMLGLCGALSVLTRPTFLPVVAAAFIWLAVVMTRASRDWKAAAGRLARFAAGFLLGVAPTAIEAYRAVGYFGILPNSGGLNIYLGNNEDTCQTLTIRPGWAWDDLTLLPEREGCTTYSERSDFFYDKVRRYATSQPLAFLRGLGHKTLQIVNGREIPRNVDIYLFRDWSKLLTGLVWKAGRFGFPWGVLFPLAVLGWIFQRRRVPMPLTLFVVLYLLGIVLVFVADRYRVPVVPVLAVLAAAGCTTVLDLVRAKQAVRLAAVCGIAAVTVLATNLSPRSCEEEVNYGAEMYALLAENAEEAGQIEQAQRLYEKALFLDPESVLANFRLGIVLARTGRLDEALARFDATIQRQPHWAAYYNRGSAYLLKRDFAQALSDLETAISVNPKCAPCYCRRAALYREQGKLARARLDWERVLEISPKGPFADEAIAGLKLLDRQAP